MIKFTVYGHPVAKARARVVQNKHTGRIHSFTPQKTMDYEADIRQEALKHRPESLLTCPVWLRVKVFRAPLRSFSKKKLALALAGEIRPDTRPDLDNYLKAVKDALKGIIWKDDGQVIEYLPGTGKYYGDPPRIEVEVRT